MTSEQRINSILYRFFEEEEKAHSLSEEHVETMRAAILEAFDTYHAARTTPP